MAFLRVLFILIAAAIGGAVGLISTFMVLALLLGVATRLDGVGGTLLLTSLGAGAMMGGVTGLVARRISRDWGKTRPR